MNKVLGFALGLLASFTAFAAPGDFTIQDGYIVQEIPLPPTMLAEYRKAGEKSKSSSESNPSNHLVNPGRFILKYTDTKNPKYQRIKDYLQKSGVLANLVAELNQKLLLPVNITILMTEKDDMFYEPDTREIHIGYRVLVVHEKEYKKRYPDASDEDAQDYATDAVEFFTFHELGHALIDVYHLPVVGNQEEAGDNLASIISLEYYKDGLQVVLDAAETFDIWDEETGGKVFEAEFQDVHPLNPSRYYNVLCLAYGRDPKQVMKVLKDVNNKVLLDFIDQQGDSCKEEYAEQKAAWFKLLKKHMK